MRGEPEAPGEPEPTREAPAPAPEGEWQALPAFVPCEAEEARVPGVIACAVAAGDRPESAFSVRSVKVSNPEARRVAVIACAVAAADRPESEFVVRGVYRKRPASDPSVRQPA